MKYLNNGRFYAMFINCGQDVSKSALFRLNQAQCPEKELVCCLSKDTPMHFTGTARLSIKPSAGPEGDYLLPI